MRECDGVGGVDGCGLNTVYCIVQAVQVQVYITANKCRVQNVKSMIDLDEGRDWDLPILLYSRTYG